MTRKQKQIIIKQTELMSDNELENLYYDSVYDCLGSQAEYMIELGYDKRDIEEREKYEKFLNERNKILETLCIARGIELWN